MKIQLTFITCCLALASCNSKPAATESAAPPPTEAIQVDPQTQKQVGLEIRPASAQVAQVTVSAPGQLQLNEDRTWKVGSITDGRIVDIPVRLGDLVEAGQILARMHSHEVHDARADQREALNELDRLKVLADQAKRVRDRTERLFNLKAASLEQLEASETEYKDGLLRVKNAEAEVQRSRDHITEFLDLDAAEVAEDLNNEDERNNVPIKAPASGTVMERLASVGTVVAAAAPVVTISDLSSLWLIAAVNEADLSLVHRQQNVTITVRAYPGRTFPGRVFQLGERLDAQTRTLQVRVLVPNPGGLLKPDMFATADFSPISQNRGVYVPESAVQDLNGKPVVFVQQPDKSLVPREVQPGARVSGQIQILSGLEVGTPVVSSGAILLKGQLQKSEGE